MKQQALGLIETHGLVAAIEAADAALKTAAVELINYQKVTGGLLTIAVTGEVAAVQAAVAAGSAAAAKVGVLVSQHVIPRPMADIELLIDTRKKSPEPPNPEPPDPNPAGSGGDGPAAEAEAPAEITEAADKAKEAAAKAKDEEAAAKAEEAVSRAEETAEEAADEIRADEAIKAGADSKTLKALKEQLTGLGVEELRRMARKTGGIAIRGRQISRANKEVLIKEILRAKKSNQ